MFSGFASKMQTAHYRNMSAPSDLELEIPCVGPRCSRSAAIPKMLTNVSIMTASTSPDAGIVEENRPFLGWMNSRASLYASLDPARTLVEAEPHLVIIEQSLKVHDG